MLTSNIIRLRSYIDKAIVKTDSNYSDFNKNYSLSFQLSLDGFSFSFLHTESNKYLAFESYAIKDIDDYEELAKELGKLLDQLDIIKRRFSRINILFEGTKYSLVPQPLFDENALKDYFKFSHKLNYDEQVRFDTLPILQAYNVYALPKPIHELIKARFINYNIKHSLSSLIEGLLIKFKNQERSDRVYVNVRKSYIDILFFQNSKLLFNNTFKYKTSEDFAYFLLNTLEQLQLNPETIDLYLMGEIDKDSQIYELLYKYIRTIEFMERNDFFVYSYSLDELPSHYFYNLLNANTCEL